jgi:hypothetical protein
VKDLEFLFLNKDTIMTKQTIIDRINKGVSEYEKDLLKMSDSDLWELCFSDGDILESDSKTEELKMRFLNKNEFSKSGVLRRLIDNVTIDRLDMTLRMCGIELHRNIIDRVIDLVELIEDKGGDVSLSDVSELKAEWKMA